MDTTAVARPLKTKECWLDKEGWLQLERSLSFPLAGQELRADGVRLVIQVERLSPKALTYGFAVYINGQIEWKYCNEPNEHAKKFWAKKNLRLYSAARKTKILDGLTKAQKASLTKSLKLDATRDFYDPIYKTFSSLRTTLIKHCEQIEWVNAPEARP